jgi:hypothetical protein
MKKTNFIIFGIGLLTLVVGNILMTIGPATNVWSLTVAPIVLTIGFCVIIPLAFLYKAKEN